MSSPIQSVYNHESVVAGHAVSHFSHFRQRSTSGSEHMWAVTYSPYAMDIDSGVKVHVVVQTNRCTPVISQSI